MNPRRSLAAVALAAGLALGGAAACSCDGTGPVDAGEGGPADSAATPDATTPDAGFDAGAEGDPDGRVDGNDSAAGVPSLVALSVAASAEGGASLPVALSPAFSPDIHDYTVRCSAGTNVLTV
ncbi:MAG TPA: hypothetical protein VHS09_01500, partial [Polyangiaceae bacterium]|nr:hypothetical protein [Polyangiaceae bacterium]